MNEEIKASVDSPAFRTEAEFAAYLDSLHETMPDGAVTNRKWGPAQRALAGLAASRAMLPVTDEAVLNAVMAFSQAGKRGCDLQGAMKSALEAALASPVAGWVSVEKPVHTIRGHVTDIGQLDDLHGAHGVVIEREGKCSVTIKMGVEDVRALASLAFDDIVISFAPAPVTPKQEQS